MLNSIYVPVKLNAEKINMLVSFLNSTDEEDMRSFVEDILRQTNKTSLKIHQINETIMQENPFSKNYLKK